MRKGFTFVEVVTAVGIVATMSVIASLYYLEYYKKAQWEKIYKTGILFNEAIQICLLYQDDPRDCADPKKLKFSCDHCVPDTGKLVRYRVNGTGTIDFRIQVQVGDYQGGAVIRNELLPPLAIRIHRLAGSREILKFCSHKHTRLDGTPAIATTDIHGNPIPPADQRQGGSIGYPIRPCANSSECETGEQCFDSRAVHWNGGTWGQ